MKKSFKLIVPSLLAIIVCVLLLAGSTFALFTSDVTKNIVVGSATVNMTAEYTEFQAYSVEATDNNTSDDYAGEATAYGVTSHYNYVEVSANSETAKTFANKGTATLTNQNTIELVNVTPGDRITANLKVTNNSNVDIIYRVRLNAISDNGLLDGLTVKVGAETLTGVIKVGAWKTWTTEQTKVENIALEVFLPVEAGNEYQNKQANLRFTVEAVQANAKTDTLLEQVNAYLATHDGNDDGKNDVNNTMYDAIQEVKGNTELAAFDATKYLWSPDTDQFYAPYTVVAGFESHFFKAYSQAEFNELTEQKYNIYATGEWTGISSTKPVNITVGFDAGETTGITNINYDRHDAMTSQKVVIRTNSVETNITINAPLDSINRYGVAGTVTINGVAQSSYHENGNAEYIEIAKGRIALELGANVKTIHLIANDNADGFESIIVSKESTVTMPTFERDPVTIDPTNGTFVVELQSDTNNDENTESDYVWLTAVGVYEQVTLGTAEEAGENYAAQTDSSKNIQKTAAQQIANNITTTISSAEYSVHAEKDAQGEWTYVLADNNGDKAEQYAVSNVAVNTIKTEDVVTSAAVVTVLESGTTTEVVKDSTTINNNTNNTTTAKEKAINDVLESGVVYNQTKGIYYHSGEGKQYATNGAALVAAINKASNNDSLILLKDVVLDDVLTIEYKTIKIIGNGNGHTITSASNQNKEDGRAINIWGDNTNVSLKNITIIGPSSGSSTRGLNIGNSNVTVNIENCNIICNDYYAINIIMGEGEVDRGYSNNINLSIKNSTIRGWSAINHHGSSGNIVIEDSTLIGVSNHSGSSDGFATIVIDGNAILDNSSSVSNNNIIIKNSSIIAQQNGTAKQSWISFQYGAKNNNALVSIDGVTTILDSTNENANSKVTTIYMSGLGNVIKVVLTSDQKEELRDYGYLVTDNTDGSSSITLPNPNIWYSNGEAVYENNELGVVNPNSQYQPLETSFGKPFNDGWLANGEGIKLIDNVSLRKNITLNMTEGSIYLILGNYTISGSGKLILQGNAKIISDKGNLISLFANIEIAVTDNNNGTYTYYRNNGTDPTQPIIINSVDAWRAFVALTKDDDDFSETSGKYYQVTTDLDVTNFGTERANIHYFAGSIDFTGHTFTGITSQNSPASDVGDDGITGIFSRIKGNVKISNLNFVTTTVTNGQHTVASQVTGRNTGDVDVVFENINTYGSVTGSNINNNGLFISYVYNGKSNITMNNCKNYANIIGPGYKSVFLGNMGYGTVQTITATNCHNYGTIISTNKEASMFISNAGYFGHSIIVTIDNCSNEGYIAQNTSVARNNLVTTRIDSQYKYIVNGFDMSQMSDESFNNSIASKLSGTLVYTMVTSNLTESNGKFVLNATEGAVKYELSFSFFAGGHAAGGGAGYVLTFTSNELANANIMVYDWINKADANGEIIEHNDYQTKYYTCGEHYVFYSDDSNIRDNVFVSLTAYGENDTLLSIATYTYSN